MKVLRTAVLLLLLTPAPAGAELASITSRELLPRPERVPAAALRFDLVGVHWQGMGKVEFRARSLAGRWSRWRPVAPEDEDRPDAPEPSRRGWQIGNPYWTGPSNGIEVRTRGTVQRVRGYFVTSEAEATPLRTLAMTGGPQLVTRKVWGANELIKRAAPRYAPQVRFAVVHHTAGSNSYTEAQAPAVVKAIQTYHVKGNGWNDIGYNFLVDKYGRVYEGRAGGVERNVIGAHAEGFNTGSFGVAVLGNYGGTQITAAAYAALVKLIAWRLDVAHVDPLTTFPWISGGSGRFRAGTSVFLRTISGHRDTGSTACPGDRLYSVLDTLAEEVGAEGLPKLYEPVVRGSIGGKIRFSGRLSGAEPWTVTVRDTLQQTVASGSGIGPVVDWTWDSVAAAGPRYTWVIEPTGARPAKGTIMAAGGVGTQPPGGTTPPPVVPLIGRVDVEPATVTPNADGLDDTTTISFALGADAHVTATLVDPAGAVRATLFDEPKPRGKRTFQLTAEAFADGQYRVVITAVGGDGSRVTSEAPLVVSRLLRNFTVEPELFSPNLDGRSDSAAFGFELAGPADVTLRILKGTAWVHTVFGGPLAPGMQTITWDGAKRVGRLLDGRYAAELSVADAVSSVSQTIELVADSTPPKLTLVSLAPLKLRLSEAATVTLTVNGKRIVTSELAGVFEVPFPGRARKLRAVAVDEAENAGVPLARG